MTEASIFWQALAVDPSAWLCAGFGALAGGFSAYAYRLLPARWLCDYGEAPQVQHAADRRTLPTWAIAALAVLCAVCTAKLAGAPLHTEASALHTQPLLVALCAACLVATLLLAAVCDAQYTILPDQLLLLAGCFTLGLWALGGLRTVHSAWHSPFVGAALGFVGLWAVLVLAGKLYQTEAMGFGDVKLLAVLGALCGPRALGVAALLAVLVGGAVMAVLLALGAVTRRSRVAFGPFLVGGALAAVCLWPHWQALGAWYLGLLGL